MPIVNESNWSVIEVISLLNVFFCTFSPPYFLFSVAESNAFVLYQVVFVKPMCYALDAVVHRRVKCSTCYALLFVIPHFFCLGTGDSLSCVCMRRSSQKKNLHFSSASMS
jgi:hypothetical protein